MTAVLASLGLAAVFEVFTVPGMQERTVWADSPWRADPYHTVVWLAEFAAAMLAVVIALRLLVWAAPGGPDRARQTSRAAGTLTAFIALALAFEWAAVLDGAGISPWSAWAWVQVGGLIALSVLAVAAAALLLRHRRRRSGADRWQHDWLGDVVLVCRRVPGLRRWVTLRAADWVRRRTMTVFVVLSAFAGAVVTGCQAFGEGLTDPLFITWLLISVTAIDLAFCMISNAVAGFVARPPLGRSRRIAEASLVAGSLVLLTAIAFHDPLWSALGSGPLTSHTLVAMTLGAGAAASLVTCALLVARTTPPDRHAATPA